MKQLVAAAALAGALLAGSGLRPAWAAEPNNQACLGHDVSGYAQGGAGFGHFLVGLAASTTGVGTEFQAHLAGLVPDSIIPNSCND